MPFTIKAYSLSDVMEDIHSIKAFIDLVTDGGGGDAAAVAAPSDEVSRRAAASPPSSPVGCGREGASAGSGVASKSMNSAIKSPQASTVA